MSSQPKATSIRLSESFCYLLKTKPLSKSKRLMLHAIKGDHPPRFGVLVPKRLAKRAVDRNTLKRLVRHACQEALVGYRGAVLIRLSKSIDGISNSERSIWWMELRQLLGCLSEQGQSKL